MATTLESERAPVVAGALVPTLPNSLRVCELFAGIGGWRLAIQAALPSTVATTFAPYDSGPHCSEVYAHNFGDTCSRRNIEQLDVASLEDFDIWAMSPPCQPFSATREAKQLDLLDKRCKALEHLCKVLPRLSKPPTWIALENVKGFHDSEACGMLQAALVQTGYTCRCFLLDLACCCVPNHRTRYYLIAERSDRFSSTKECVSNIPGHGTIHRVPHNPSSEATVVARGPWARLRKAEVEEAYNKAQMEQAHEVRHELMAKLRSVFICAISKLCDESAGALSEGTQLKSDVCALLQSSTGWDLMPLPRGTDDTFIVNFHADIAAAGRFVDSMQTIASTSGTSWSLSCVSTTRTRPISDFLDEVDLSAPQHSELMVPQAVLEKPFAKGLSYVEPNDTISFCFTGHYGKVLHKSSGSLLHFPSESGLHIDRSDPSKAHGAVRFFSPKEILNMLGFPEDYQLKSDMQLRHRYKVVGNSIAVTVAADLIRMLLLGEGDDRLASLGKELTHQYDAM